VCVCVWSEKPWRYMAILSNYKFTLCLLTHIPPTTSHTHTHTHTHTHMHAHTQCARMSPYSTLQQWPWPGQLSLQWTAILLSTEWWGPPAGLECPPKDHHWSSQVGELAALVLISQIDSLLHRPTQSHCRFLPVLCTGRGILWLLSCFRVLCRNLCRASNIADSHMMTCDCTSSD